VKWNCPVRTLVTKIGDRRAATPQRHAKMILKSLLFYAAATAINQALTLIRKDHRESSGDPWHHAQNRRDDYLGRSR
jgi:hypothetical protein